MTANMEDKTRSNIYQSIDERCENGVDSWGPDNWVVRGSVDSGCHNLSKKLAINWRKGRMLRLYTDDGRTELEARILRSRIANSVSE